MVSVVGPVGGMEIYGEVRIVVRVEPDQAPGLGCIQLHLVPVQVQPHGIGTLAHSRHRSVLSPAVRGAHPLVSVRVVEGSDQQDQGVGPVPMLPLRQLPKEDEKSFLPRDLSGMDTTLDVNPGLPAGSNRLWSGVRHLPHDHEWDRSPFVGGPHGGQVHAGISGHDL